MNYVEFSKSVDDAYGLFQAALSGIYFGISGSNTEVSPHLLRDYKNRARVAAGAFLNQLTAIADQFDTLVGQNPQESRITDFVHAARLIVAENIKTVERKMIEPKISLVSMLRSAAHGGIGMLAQRRASSVDFKSVDSAGRTWNSSKLMHFYARDFAYQTLIDSQLFKLKREGSVVAKVVYADENHVYQNLVLSLNNVVDGHPTVAELRNVIFHPNASAEISYV